MKTLMVETELVVEICQECGGIYALNKEYMQIRKEKGGHWHCPYCEQSWVFRESDLQIAQKELQQQIELTTKIKQEKEAALKEADYFRKERNRILNRAEKGVCPHCHRYFKNLHRHINSKHENLVEKRVS